MTKTEYRAARQLSAPNEGARGGLGKSGTRSWLGRTIPGTEMRHPDIPRVYYTWRQCCIAEGIEVERIMRQIKRDAAKAKSEK